MWHSPTYSTALPLLSKPQIVKASMARFHAFMDLSVSQAIMIWPGRGRP